MRATIMRKVICGSLLALAALLVGLLLLPAKSLPAKVVAPAKAADEQLRLMRSSGPSAAGSAQSRNISEESAREILAEAKLRMASLPAYVKVRTQPEFSATLSRRIETTTERKDGVVTIRAVDVFTDRKSGNRYVFETEIGPDGTTATMNGKPIRSNDTSFASRRVEAQIEGLSALDRDRPLEKFSFTGAISDDGLILIREHRDDESVNYAAAAARATADAYLSRLPEAIRSSGVVVQLAEKFVGNGHLNVVATRDYVITRDKLIIGTVDYNAQGVELQRDIADEVIPLNQAITGQTQPKKKP